MRKLWLGVVVGLVGGLVGCSDEVVNNPYPSEQVAENVFYTAFTQRSPRTLDSATSYSADETPITYSVYEPLYGYHYLERPYKLMPRAAVEVVEPYYLNAQGERLPSDADGEQVAISVYDISLRSDILYQPHPAFARTESGGYHYWPITQAELEGKYAIPDFSQSGTRPLVANDVVYAFKRLASPRVVSPIFSTMAAHVEGMRDYGEQLKEVNQGLPAEQWLDLREYDLSGVQALDEHTLRIRVLGKYPQFKYWLAMTFVAPVPWEADRFYHQPGMAEHGLSFSRWPVGTGPYMLTEYIPNRRHELTRNPNFRGEPYPCEGSEADKAAGLLVDCGKSMPFIDKAIFSIEKESVPLMGKFLQGYYDIPQLERGEYGVAMLVAAEDSPDKALLYQERALQLSSATEASLFYMGFNWLDPIVGKGDTPEQAERNRYLRQAISIAFDWEEFVSIFQNDQAEAAHSPLPPGVVGYEPLPEGMNPTVYENEQGQIRRRSLDEARALLAKAGYPDGRNSETGAPLILYYDSMTGMGASASLDWMRRQLQAIGVQFEVRASDYNRFQEKMSKGSAQLFLWGWVADYPDAENFLFQLYGPQAKVAHGGENAANYENPEYDKLFKAMRYLDDGPEKEAVIRKMVSILQEDAVWMFGYFPKSGGAAHAWVHNLKPSQMVRNTLQYLRIDPERRVVFQQRWNQPYWWPLWMLLIVAGGVAVYLWRQVKKREQQTVRAVPNYSKGDQP
ncbi:MAG: ABC transporter substrate-binding protein [Paenalcaligenes sp.]